jgi:SAM-dependent methyltransferase
MTIVNGVADKLPFPDSSFDIVTCSLAPWNITEVYRVLKTGGYFINETIGCADKIEFKKEFGLDESGILRGQLIQDTEEHYLSNLRKNIESNLSVITLKNGFWNTMYTRNGLLELCKVTPTIKDFNEIADKFLFDNAIAKLQTEDVIILKQNRVLIVGIKSD